MNGLLDYIFSSLDYEKLGRQEVESYLRYLDEILPQLTSNEKKSEFLLLKLKLNQKLIDIGKQEFINAQKVIVSNQRKLKPIKFKRTLFRLEEVYR